MKAALQRVKLRASFWNGQPAKPGDFLRTATGRTYEIIEIRGKVLECRVLPKGAVIDDDATVFVWLWSPRKRRH